MDCRQSFICSVLCFALQGDLFSEAPKPPVSEEKRSVNESVKSTAQTAGKTLFIDKYGKIIYIG